MYVQIFGRDTQGGKTCRFRTRPYFFFSKKTPKGTRPVLITESSSPRVRRPFKLALLFWSLPQKKFSQQNASRTSRAHSHFTHGHKKAGWKYGHPFPACCKRMGKRYLASHPSTSSLVGFFTSLSFIFLRMPHTSLKSLLAAASFNCPVVV